MFEQSDICNEFLYSYVNDCIVESKFLALLKLANITRGYKKGIKTFADNCRTMCRFSNISNYTNDPFLLKYQ